MRNYTLLLTKEKQDQGYVDLPFKEGSNLNDTADYNTILKDVPNAKTVKSRLDNGIIAEAVKRLVQPYRIVVSGPDAFNNACRKLLDEHGVESKQVTLLSA